jgi:hypothetical protein
MEQEIRKRIAVFLSEELPEVIAKALFKDKKQNFMEELANLGNEGNDWQQKKVSLAHLKIKD